MNRSVWRHPELSDLLGYARVSTAEQDLEVQRRRLRDEARAIHIFEDVVSGNSFDPPSDRRSDGATSQGGRNPGQRKPEILAGGGRR
jgi:hypothetical protein